MPRKTSHPYITWRASRGCWQVQMPDGRGRRWPIYVRGTLNDARAALRDALTAKPKDVARVSLSQLFNAFLEEAAHRIEPSTLARYQHDLREWEVFAGEQGATMVEDVDYAVAKGFQLWLRKPRPTQVKTRKGVEYEKLRRWRNKTINECVHTLRTIWNWGRREGRPWTAAVNPWAELINLPRKDSRYYRPLAPEETLKMLLWARQHMPEFFLQLLFLAYTGVRAGEAIALRWRDLDLERGLAAVHTKKTSRSHLDRFRVVVLHQSLHEALKAAFPAADQARQGYPEMPVFAGSVPLKPDAWRWRVQKVAKAVGVDCSRSHQFRHFVITELDAHGFSDKLISTVSGHKSLDGLNIYKHPGLEQQRRALAASLPALPGAQA